MNAKQVNQIKRSAQRSLTKALSVLISATMVVMFPIEAIADDPAAPSAEPEAVQQENASVADAPETRSAIDQQDGENADGSIAVQDVQEGLVVEGDTVTGYTGDATTVVIPSGVKVIGEGAFENNKTIEEVVLPEGLESIGDYSFYGCKSLRSIRPALQDEDDMHRLALPEGCKSIGVCAFDGCSIEGELIFPSTIESVGNSAFCGNAITSVVFGEALSYLGESPFYGCDQLESLTFLGENPPSGSNHYSGIWNLESVYCPRESYIAYEEAWGAKLPVGVRLRASGAPDFLVDGGVLVSYGGSDVLVRVPDGVTAIGNGAFRNNIDIKKVVLPEGLTSVGASAFESCSALQSVGLAAEGEFPVDGVTLPEGCKFIDDYAFHGLTSLKGAISLPSTLETVGESAFAGCAGLTGSLVLPDGLSSLGSYAFRGCKSLDGSLSLGASLVTVSDHAFAGCSFSGALEVPASVSLIDNYAFYNNAFSSLSLPEGLTRIGYCAFDGCSIEGKLTIPATVIRVEDSAFCGNAITAAVFGEALSYLGGSPFYGCDQLESLTFLGENPPSGAHAFYGTPSALKTVYCPKGSIAVYQEAWEPLLPEGVTIQEIEFSPFEITDDGTLISHTGSDAFVRIPDGVTAIGEGVFEGNATIEEVILPEGLESVGNNAFKDCASLRAVGFEPQDGASLRGLTLPEGCKLVGSSAFDGCGGIAGQVTLPSTLKSIGSRAFYGCESLSWPLTLPDGLSSLGDYAFANCRGFNGELTLGTSLTKIPAHSFEFCPFKGPLVIPVGVTVIGECAFHQGGQFDSVSLPEGLKSIEMIAFDSCHIKGDLVIPSTVTDIKFCAFTSNDFSSVLLGKSLTHLSRTALLSNRSLRSITFLGTVPPPQDYNEKFTSQDLPSLKTIYCPESSLAAYQEIWGDWIPEGAELLGSDIKLLVSGLGASYVLSHSVGLAWDAHSCGNVIGYNVYLDGKLLQSVDAPECVIDGLTDEDLAAGKSYAFEVAGVTAGGNETPRASITVTPQAPEITSVYTKNESNKLGVGSSKLFAAVNDNGNLAGKPGVPTTARFYYLAADGSRVQIGKELSNPSDNKDQQGIYSVDWDVSNIAAGEYQIVFEITDADGETVTRQQTVTVDNAAPAKISSVVAVGDVGKVSLSWSKSHEIDTTRYHIYRKADSEDEYTLIKRIYERDTLSWSDENVQAGERYRYYVVGVSDFGVEGPASNTAIASAQADIEKPVVVQLVPASGSYLSKVASLHAQARDNVQVAKTELYLSADDGQTWELLASNNADYCNFDWDTTAIQEGAVKIKAIAYDAAGNVSDDYVNAYRVDNVGPAKVAGLEAQATATTITLKWNDVPDQDFLHFRLEMRNADGSYSEIQTISTTLGANVYNLKPGTAYAFRVTAYDRWGNAGEPSDVIEVTTADDTTAPVVTAIAPDAGYANGVLEARVTASDDSAVKSITVQTSTDAILWDDAVTVEFAGTNRTETAAHFIDTAAFEEGILFVRGVATDTVGNVGDSSSAAPYVQYIVDRTAPAAPEGFTADTSAGYIELKWSASPENDVDGFVLYRAADGGDYQLVQAGIACLNYFDRTAEVGVTYSYKLAVRDMAGNESEVTEPLTAQLPKDTEAPVIQSISPADNSVLGPSRNTVSVAASDNYKLDRMSIRYAVNGGQEAVLTSEQGINTYYQTISGPIDIAQLNNGDKVTVTASCVDAQGLESQPVSVTYTVDKEAPRVASAQAVGDTEKITVSWKGNGESDLAGYRIYRRADQGDWKLIAQRNAQDAASSYDDCNVDARQTYAYKVEAVDQVGNASSRETDNAWLVYEAKVTPVLECEDVLEQGTEYEFNALESQADAGVASYSFDFGDGTSISQSATARVVHKFAGVGDYTVTLTVADNEGCTASIEKKVQVKEPQLLGTVAVKVVDANGSALANIPVFFDMENASDNIKTTGYDGNVRFSAEAASYAVGAYADGYLPVKKLVVVQANNTVEVELVMVKKQIVTGSFEIDRMTLDEIIAAGIDVKDPANQQVVNVTVRLVYGTEKKSFSFIANGNNEIISGGTTIVNTDEGQRKVTATVVSGGGSANESSGGSWGGFKNGNAVIALIDVPVEATFLKEFFDVKLHILNNASSEFSLSSNQVTLNVPDGMTLMTNATGCDAQTVRFDKLAGQQQRTLSWILRGDDAGDYNLSANYNAVLDGFNAPVSAQFETSEPIHVYGKKSIKLIAEVNSSIRYDALYFNLAVENTGGADIYLPTIDVADGVVTSYQDKASLAHLDADGDDKEDGELKGDDAAASDDSKDLSEDADGDASDDVKINEVKVLMLNSYLQTAGGPKQLLGMNQVVSSLAKDEAYGKKYVAYNAIDYNGQADFTHAVSETADALGIDYEVRSIDMDLYGYLDADNLFENITNDPAKMILLDIVRDPSRMQYLYYAKAMENDDSYWSDLEAFQETFYGLRQAVFSFDFDSLSGEDEKTAARKLFVNLLKDDCFAEAVAAEEDREWLDITKSFLGVVESLLKETAVSEDKDGDIALYKAVASSTENQKSLASALSTGGSSGFVDRLTALLIGSGIQTGTAAILRQKIGDDSSKARLMESVQVNCGYMKDAVGYLKDVVDATEDASDMYEEIVAISSARTQSIKLADTLLDSGGAIAGATRAEVEEIRKAFEKGFASQDELLGKELAKAALQEGGKVSVKKLVEMTAETICGTSAATNPVAAGWMIAKALSAEYDYVFNMSGRIQGVVDLRVAAQFTDALCRTYDWSLFNNDSDEFLSSIKYLIRLRLYGEKTFVDLVNNKIDDASLTHDLMKYINLAYEADYSNIDEYYKARQNALLACRDQLFNSEYSVLDIPDAPEVSVDYAAEKTMQSFSSKYEYSFDGASWADCSGDVISLTPGVVGKYLWVRLKGTKVSAAGNVAKVYVPARPWLDCDVKVAYANGTYRIGGLPDGRYTFAVSDKGSAELDSLTSAFAVKDGAAVIEAPAGRYVHVAADATGSSFRSLVKTAVVETGKKVTVKCAEGEGSVSGSGVFFDGETVTLEATPADGYKFVGWYKDGELVSSDAKFLFVVASDAEYVAKFEQMDSIASCDISLSSDSFTYNGLEQKPAVSVTRDYAPLTENVDFSVAFENNVDAGTAYAVVSGMGDYAGQVRVPFAIDRAQLEVVTKSAFGVVGNGSITADGSIFGFVNGETATFAVTGLQGEVGLSVNTYMLTWDGTAKRDNYKIHETLGVLTMAEKAGSVVGTRQEETDDGSGSTATVYPDLATALAQAAEGSVLTLLGDVEDAGSLAVSGKCVSLDMNGFSVALDAPITLVNGAELIVTDESETGAAGAISCAGTMDSLVKIDGASRFVLRSGSLALPEDADGAVVSVSGSGSSFEMTGGSLGAAGSSAGALRVEDGAQAAVSGGTVRGSVSADDRSKVAVSGGQFDASVAPAFCKPGSTPAVAPVEGLYAVEPFSIGGNVMQGEPVPGTIFSGRGASEMVVRVAADDYAEAGYGLGSYPATSMTFDAGNGSVAGYVFAGWYGDAECTMPVLAKGLGDRYARFVDANVLTIKRQVTAGSQLTSEKTNLRVLTTVDSLDYQVVGFEFAINNGEAFNREATTVYRSVASHEGGQVVANNPDKLFSSESTHFLSWEFYNIPQSDFGSTIQVTPYWQTADGAKVMGKTREFTIAEAIEAEAA